MSGWTQALLLPGRPAAAGPGARVDVLSPVEAAALEPEWTALSEDAAERNPFFSPALLTPALAAFADKSVHIAAIRDDDGRLIGLIPLRRERGYGRIPVSYLATWMHPHCFFAAPLVRKGCEATFFQRLFEHAETQGAFLRLRHLDADGALFAAAVAGAKNHGGLTRPSAIYQRAQLKGGYNAEAYIDATLRKKKRKEINRLRARLIESGPLSFRTLGDKDDLDQWCAEFLALEASGWKGRSGTAFKHDSASEVFFREAVVRMNATGALRFHRLDHDGRAIAMIVNFIEGGEGYSFKIAYDEGFARYSPGVLLEIEMLKELEAEPMLAFIDSCAASDHPMINSLWRERRTISALNVSRTDAIGKAIFGALNALETLRAHMRGGKSGGRA